MPYGVKNDTLHYCHHKCHRKCTKLFKSRHVVKRLLLLEFGHAPLLKRAWVVLRGALAPPLKGFLPILALLRFEDSWYVMSQIAEGVCYIFVPTPSCLDFGVVLLFQEYLEAAENTMGSLHIPTIICKGGGVSWGYRVWLGFTNGEPKLKLRSVGESALQKCGRLSGNVAEIDILARFNSR